MDATQEISRIVILKYRVRSHNNLLGSESKKYLYLEKNKEGKTRYNNM